MSYFNIRVYGLLVNNQQEILLSDEQQWGRQFTKFPGGGLELGEGLLDCLKREFMEECDLPIEIVQHVYTTDFYEQSSFNDSQIISIYYQIKALSSLCVDIKTERFDFGGIVDPAQRFRWKPVHELDVADLTFETDRRAFAALANNLIVI